jgi:hypothetical protein
MCCNLSTATLQELHIHQNYSRSILYMSPVDGNILNNCDRNVRYKATTNSLAIQTKLSA